MNNQSSVWCLFCRSTLPPNADICPQCKQRLTDSTRVVRCPHCGRYLLKIEHQCAGCGYDLNGAASGAPSAPPFPRVLPGAESAGAAYQPVPPAMEQPAGQTVSQPAAQAAPVLTETPEANPLREMEEGEKRVNRAVLIGAFVFILCTAICIGTYFGGKKAGYADGYRAGAYDGIKQGGKASYDLGYQEGFSAGSYQNGYEEGYNDGHTEGSLAGYSSGYDDGEKAGYEAGYREGSSKRK